MSAVTATGESSLWLGALDWGIAMLEKAFFNDYNVVGCNRVLNDLRCGDNGRDIRFPS